MHWSHHNGLKSLQLPDNDSSNTGDRAAKALQTQPACMKGNNTEMDPLTAIGAVASIAQLAQGALSLSKALYSLGSAVASASDDIQVLADDLKTFSQSLTLLSRLLEDSKSWYSDDIYLLTAKIIKDCAELYVKIDKILVKLGGNGKSTWKLRVKYVYKEGQIRKLMKRLRDMKGTLATILMSLQVDLQLSLL